LLCIEQDRQLLAAIQVRKEREMIRNSVRIIVAAAATVIFGNLSAAQNLDEITVQGTRVMSTKRVGRTASGVPIKDISLSYGVSFADLDLASHAGALELEKRVHGAAKAACNELGKQFPDSTPSADECTKLAVNKAMPAVQELEAAAGNKSAK
jgi:UrcA family protein